MVNYQFKKTLGFKASLQERKRKERRKILNQVNRRRRLELEVVQQGGGLFSGIGTGGFGTGGGAAIGGGGGLFGQSGSGSGTGGFGGGLGTGWIWWNEPVVKPSPAIASEDQLDTENRAHELRFTPCAPCRSPASTNVRLLRSSANSRACAPSCSTGCSPYAHTRDSPDRHSSLPSVILTDISSKT